MVEILGEYKNKCLNHKVKDVFFTTLTNRPSFKEEETKRKTTTTKQRNLCQ